MKSSIQFLSSLKKSLLILLSLMISIFFFFFFFFNAQNSNSSSASGWKSNNNNDNLIDRRRDYSRIKICDEDGNDTNIDCFVRKKGTLTDIRRIRSNAVEVEEEEKESEELGDERKRDSRDLEHAVVRMNERFKEFERRDKLRREERRIRLSGGRVGGYNGKNIKGFEDVRKDKPGERAWVFRASDGFVFGFISLLLYAFRNTRAPLVASCASISFGGTCRIFTDSLRTVIIVALVGAILSMFVLLAMPVLEKVVEEDASKIYEDDDDVEDGFCSDFSERNGVFVERLNKKPSMIITKKKFFDYLAF